MEPDDSKDAEPTSEAQDAAPAPLEIGFNEAELRELSASLDLEAVALLNLC